MNIITKAIELEGNIDKNHNLLLDEPLTEVPPGKVRVILMFKNGNDIDEQAWLTAASQNPVFDFLKKPDEDIYTDLDGKAFND
jgi:hypothetical protein